MEEMATPVYDDQCKPRGRKPKGKAKSDAAKAKPKKAVREAAKADVAKVSSDETIRAQKRARLTDEDEDDLHSECDHALGIEAKLVPDGVPLTVEDLLKRFEADPEVELPGPDQLTSAQVQYMTPPDWVSCNNVYTAVYKSLIKKSPDVVAAKLGGRLATKMWRKDGIILQDLLGSHVFRAAKPKPRAKRARTDEPGQAQAPASGAQPDHGPEEVQNPGEVPKVGQAEV